MTRHILAIDPGKKTGICLFSIEPGGEPVLEWSSEIDEHEVAPAMRHYLNIDPATEVVCERFLITVETAKKTQAPYSLELIGVIKQTLRDFNRSETELALQTPVDAKTMFPNPQLKKLEYWHRGGAGHALDSIRHGLLYLVRTGWKPTRLLQ